MVPFRVRTEGIALEGLRGPVVMVLLRVWTDGMTLLEGPLELVPLSVWLDGIVLERFEGRPVVEGNVAFKLLEVPLVEDNVVF
jgi:hypothetical protein